MQRRLALSQSAYKISDNRQTIQASNLRIKTIDEFSPGLASKIKYLNISRNLITKLENMRQFIFLQEIDLSNNLIRNGKQLICLEELPRLYKIYVEGNPFLLEPLDEDVLELLIEKQTDIEILSGEALNRIKDLQEGELKVVFLENYLKKISCHDEIMARRNGKFQSNKQSLLNQQNANRHIINKIMPQFYSIIDDPKLKTKIKKQTIGIKRQEHLTFEDAMKKKKEKQQSQVDNLIKDILLLVEEQDEQIYENNSHQEYQDINMEHSSRYQESKPPISYKQHLQEIQKLQESSIGSPEGFRRKMSRIKNILMSKTYQKEVPDVQQKKTKTSKKLTLPDNKNKTSEFSHWENFNQFDQEPENLGQEKGSNFYSFNKTTPMPFRNVHQEASESGEKGKFETKKQENLFSISQQKEKQFLLLQTRRNEKDKKPETQVGHQEDNSMTQISAAQLYEQYYAHLTKYNPAFALLYSDISSLSSEEKEVLIEALAKDHKNKTIELFMQRVKLKNMKKISIQNASAHEKQRYDLHTQVAEQKENYQLCKQYSEQLLRQNTRLSQLIKVVSEDITEVKEENKFYKQINMERGNQLSELTSGLRSKQNYIKHLEECDNLYEVIKANKNKRIKAQYFQIILKRATQNTRVAHWSKKRQQRYNEKLINVSWSLMKKHLLLHMLAKMKQTDKNSSILKDSFELWKQGTQQNKLLKKNARKLQNLLRLKNLRIFRNQMQKKKSVKKQGKLHIFWAEHHLMKNWFFKIRDRTRKSKSETQIKMKDAYEDYLRSRKSKIFFKIKQMALQTKNHMAGSTLKLKHRWKSSFYGRWKKFFTQKLIEQQRTNKIKAISRIVILQRSDRCKIEALKNLKRQNEQLKQKSSIIARCQKEKVFKKLFNSVVKIKQQNEMKQKRMFLNKKIYLSRFRLKMKKYLRFLRSIKCFFIRIKKKALRNEATIQSKCCVLQNRLKDNRIRTVLYKLLRNKFESKLFKIEVHQRMEQEQTKILLERMRNIQSMELQAIKSEHHRQLQLIEEEDFKKEVDYRNSLMKMENGRNELEDMVKILKKQVEGLKGRENIFFREKELIEEQVRIAESGKLELCELNENLRIEIANINTKYQRMLELYTQAMIQLEKKQKNVDIQQKQRNDKTVEKQKRQVGVTKNGEFTSLRQRGL